ncbi:dynamin family protein [uncultured Veillonella sp.]|uniref:dynamin family protein n=1 Tax=uncultured Veillonella sp. TaxID=159268 RepID=UPI0026124BE1|nr:dynamin family protein [uncultured Veillonella sp.]
MVELRHMLAMLKELPYVAGHKHILGDVEALERAMEKDFFRVVVLGEFKRGKSTFINALLGEDILPTDVLPETAIITNLLYATEPRLQVVYKNKTIEEKPLTAEAMAQFSAQADTQYTDTIDYIKVGYPLDLLKPKICLVDTPGVADLEESRSDITYGYLPRANGVIFLLDANTPFTKTEKDFIEQHILPLGISEIIFIVNKYDHVDEEEDEDFLDDLQARITQAFIADDGTALLKDIKLFPASALMARRGQLQHNEALLEESGIPVIAEALRSMLGVSSLEQKKTTYYTKAMTRLVERIIRDVERTLQLGESSLTELQATGSRLDALMAHHKELESKIFTYINQSTAVFNALIHKSLDTFKEELTELVVDMVTDYEGEDFKKIVEEKIPRIVRKQIEQWLVNYGPQLKLLLKQLEQELSNGLARHFNRTVQLPTGRARELNYSKQLIQLEVSDLSNTKMWAAGVAAIGGMGLISVLGSTMMPLLGAVVIPFIVKDRMKDALKEAKSQVLPQLKAHMEQIFVQLEAEIHQYVDLQCKEIGARTETSYFEILGDLKKKVDSLLDQKEKERLTIEGQMLDIKGDKKVLQSYMEVLATKGV